MKAACIVLALLLPILASAESPTPAPTPRSAPELRQLLQEGLFEEEANRNLDKASAAYESLLQSFDQNRQFAATALFRLAEIRAKQNRKDDALALFKRVSTEFDNVDPLSRLSRERIAALGGRVPDAAAAAASIQDEEAKEIARLEDLVKNSPDLLNSPKDGITPLGRAAQKGWLKAAAFLLDHNADINAPRDGWPALHLAVTDGRKAMVELLIVRGADLNQKDVNDRTPLQIAADYSRVEVARVLLDKGAKQNLLSMARQKDGRSPLHAACFKGDLAMARLLLDRGADVNLKSPDDNIDYDGTATGTPLMVAIRVRNKDLAELLLDHHADPNIEVGTEKKSSALLVATGKGDVDLARLLIDRGAKPDLLSLRVAVGKRNAELAALLMERGVKPDAPDLLWDAVYDCNADMVQLLVKNGADLNSVKVDTYGTTALHLAVSKSKQITKLLLEKGASVNVKNDAGRTPAHCVLLGFSNSSAPQPPTRVQNSSLEDVGPPPKPEEILELLVAKGADLNARDRNGLTVFHWLMQRETPFELIEWFLAHGADPNAKDSEGRTPAMLAPLNRRIFLEERSLYLPWAKQQAIHAIVRGAVNSGEPRRFEPAAGFDLPPSLNDVILAFRSDLMSAGSPASIHNDVVVCRSGSEGKLVEAVKQPFDAPQNAKLEWGDVVVLTCGELPSPSASPTIRVSKGKAESDIRKITIQVGERQEEVQLADLGLLRSVIPALGYLPDWHFSNMLTPVVEAEPRAKLDAIKVQRTVDGKQEEWTVDLRPDSKAKIVKYLPARLADGDRVIIPLRAANDLEALAVRRTKIIRAFPGRVFGSTVFALTDTDSAPHTLGEFLMEAYRLGPWYVPAPDLAHVRIYRLKGDSGEEETMEIDLAAAIGKVSPQTSEEEARKLDVPLQWGDVVEIASSKDSDPKQWTGFSGQMKLFLIKALTRSAGLVTNGNRSNSLRFAPSFPEVSSVVTAVGNVGQMRITPASFRALSGRYGEMVPNGDSGSTPRSQFQLRQNDLKLRLYSRGTVREFTPEEFKTANPWILDGDQIEVESY